MNLEYQHQGMNGNEAAVLIVLILAVAAVRLMRWYRMNSADIGKTLNGNEDK